MPRYVILYHETSPASPRPSHWDFMLETGEVLRTWALASEPSAEAAIEAMALPDHRPAYLQYEGPVSKDRGEVRRWDAGDYQMIEDSPACVAVVLRGERLQGAAALRMREPPPDGEAQRWTFCFSVSAAAC